MFVIALFGAFAVYLTKQVTHLQKVRALSSVFSRATYSSNKRNCAHLVLMGECNTEGIETFLKECFHQDHGKSQIDVVILRRSDPTEDIKEILELPQYEGKVIYIKGNALDKEALQRCCIE